MDPTFVLEHIRATVVVIDRCGLILHACADPRYSAGYSSQQLIGRHATEFVIAEEQAGIASVLSDAAAGSPSTSAPSSFPVTINAADGSRQVFDVMGSGFEREGRSGWVLTMVSRNDQPTPHDLLEMIVDRRPLEEIAEAVAKHATSSVAGSQVAGYVILHPNGDFPHVVSSGPHRPLNNAVRVLVESRNDRMWREAPPGEPIEMAVVRLPEIVRAAAELEQMAAVHIGRITIDGETEAVVLWFVTATKQSSLGRNSTAARRNILRLLNVAVEHHHSAQLLRASADQDALTGLTNREVFDRALSELESEQATLVFIDLDHFKDVNDTYGHHVGDQVLAEVANRMRTVCRPKDLIARLGGDEFAVLLTNVDRSEALGVAKRLLSAIGEPLPASFGPERISASVGVAHQFGALDPEELLEAADEAMNSGKRSGRDRVVIAS
jgi:diguanylate cyclase (GGDEF)-like protein